jgi:hypothetical protein
MHRMLVRLLATLFALSSCSAQVADLDGLHTDSDACDPRGSTQQGSDLDLTFQHVSPHINQDMFFAVTQGKERNIESMFVLSTLDDPNLHLVVPKLLPAGNSELAFWADSDPPKFDALDSDNGPDHQWTRPICPNGRLTFTHATPFQDVQGAIATGAVFSFEIPKAIQRKALFDRYKIWVRVTQLADLDHSTELQTRAFFRWSPHVAVPGYDDVPEQREPPATFQIGGNVLGEGRGPIDTLSFYNVELVIDLDDSGDLSGDDFVCRYKQERAPDSSMWKFEADLARCDAPADFDPATFEP